MAKRKRTKKTMIYGTLHRKLTIELNEWTPERVGSS